MTIAGHVLIAGGASGIGLAVAERLLDTGVMVTILDADQGAVADCEDRFSGEDVVCLACDVTDEQEMADSFAQAADTQGPLTGLVNCAAIADDVPFERTSAALFRQIVDVNLTGTFIACKTALDHMAEMLSVVNLASVSGLRANAGRTAYGASKAGVVLMSQVMAAELGASGVRVNVVAPGPIDTPLIARLHSAEDRRVWASHVPQRRYGSPADVAAAVCFLLSDEAAYIHGHVLAVDGGFLSAGILRER